MKPSAAAASLASHQAAPHPAFAAPPCLARPPSVLRASPFLTGATTCRPAPPRRARASTSMVVSSRPAAASQPAAAAAADEGQAQAPALELDNDAVGLSYLDNGKVDPRSYIPSGKLPSIAVVGRPNVGKSMLVNRLAQQFRGGAIVQDIAGITRDRTYRRAFWGIHEFEVIDTGGLVFDDNSVFMPEIRDQVLVALAEASAAVLVVDGQAGVNPLDTELAGFLRKECKGLPVYLAVNKCESDDGWLLASEFWELGMGTPHAVSAIHGTGTGELLDEVVSGLPLVKGDVDDGIVNVAIVGRPNVGKSSLLNVISGKDRAIVSEVAGTTRDAIDELVKVHGKTYRLIDTAGIRRKTSINYGTEFFMINRAFKAIRRADVVLLIVDVSEGATDQDRKIAERVAQEGKACVIVANKWDLIEEKDNRSYKSNLETVREKMAAIIWAEADLVSALHKQRTSKLLEYADSALEQNSRRVSTAVLNEVLREAVDWHKPPASKQGKQGRVYYCTQVATCPPTIAMFVNSPQLFHDNYRRYMEKQFRKALGFQGTPIRIVWRGKASAPTL